LLYAFSLILRSWHTRGRTEHEPQKKYANIRILKDKLFAEIQRRESTVAKSQACEQDRLNSAAY
jgi:hypothetical protein